MHVLFQDVLCGSVSVEKLVVSFEARTSFDHAKSQLLLILIEALDLENLLQMVHDEVPYRFLSNHFDFIYIIYFLFLDMLFDASVRLILSLFLL